MTPWESKTRPTTCAENEKIAQEQGQIERLEKARLGYDLATQRIKQVKELVGEVEREKHNVQDQEKKKAPQEKRRQDKEAEKQRDQGEIQQESSSLGDMRTEIDRARKELGRDIRTLREKEREKSRERETKHMNWKKSVYENNAVT